MWERKTNRMQAFVSRMDGTDRLHPRRRRRLSQSFGRSSQQRISANLLVAPADSGAIRRINFALH
jgi:hypothetical protein